MKAVVHYPDETQTNPSGIWWMDGETENPLSYYHPSAPPRMQVLGNETMQAKVSDCPWEIYFDQLGDRLPGDDDWESMQASQAANPAELLDALRTGR